MKRGLFWILPRIALLVGAIALVRDTVSQGQDFEVFYRAGHNLIFGEPIYSLSRDGAMVFKYPPWFVPFFVPFSLLSLNIAKVIWGLMQVGSLAYICRWLRKTASWFSLLICLFFYFGIWAVHALDGQIILPWLALMLFLRSRFPAATVFMASLKIYTVVCLPGFIKKLNRQIVGWTVFAVLVFSYPAFLAQHSPNLLSLMESWTDCARSGDQYFGIEKIFGRENQGFPALGVRLALLAGWSESQAGILALSLSVFLILGLGFFWYRRTKDQEDSVVAWLALVPIVMPLSWFHGFVLSFPLAVLTVDRSPRLWTALGLICITAITAKTLGPVGRAMEFISIKSIGVVWLFFISTVHHSISLRSGGIVGRR